MVKTTITEAVEDLEKASDGEEVRQALIDLLDTLNTIGGDTYTLGKKDQTYYVTEAEFEQFETDANNNLGRDKLPEGPQNPSLRLIGNEDLSNYLVGILEKIKKLNGNTQNNYDEADIQVIGRDIAGALDTLNTTMDLIKGGIGEKGVTVPDTDSVMDYAKRISEINMTTIEVVPYLVTVPDKVVPETRDPETHNITKAYNPVTVELDLQGDTGVAKENGPLVCREGYDGFKTVTVDVDNSGSRTSSSSPYSGSGSGSYRGKTGIGAISDDVTYNLGGADIRSNTTYNASDYGLDAFSSADVTVTDYEMEDKTLHVKFMNEETVLQEVDVKMGEPAVYTGDTIPEKEDPNEFYYFTGWDPVPSRVIEDMECYAMFDVWCPNGGTPIESNYMYLQATWEDIIANKLGQEGDIKLLRLTDGRVIRMRKISSQSESGAMSVWMAMEGIQPTTAAYDVPSSDLTKVSWEDTLWCSYFNGEFINTLIPEPLRSAIKPMQKQSLVGFKEAGAWTFHLELSAAHKIWWPGLYEINYMKKSDMGDLSQGNYHPSILTPVTEGGYTGKVYNKFFNWFEKGVIQGGGLPLKDQLKRLYDSYNGGGSIPDILPMIRQLYPHTNKTFTIPEHEEDGQVVPAKTYSNWDSLPIEQKIKWISLEVPFDNYKIEYEELGGGYNPWMPLAPYRPGALNPTGFDGTNMLKYRELARGGAVAGTILRDSLPVERYGARFQSVPQFSAIDIHGNIELKSFNYENTDHTNIPFCFGL